MGVSYLGLPYGSLGDSGARADVAASAPLTRLILLLHSDTWGRPIAAARAVGKRALDKCRKGGVVVKSVPSDGRRPVTCSASRSERWSRAHRGSLTANS